MKTPEQVQQVYDAMVANAKEAKELDDSVHLGHYGPEDWQSQPHEEWIIGDNYERGPFSLGYRSDKDQRFYRDKWSGEDRLMPGGFEEAMGNASIWYTG
jgi:hypothetical protein